MRNRIATRLGKLEQNARVQIGNLYDADGRFEAAEKKARQKLSPAESKLLDEAKSLFNSRREDEWTEAQREIWERWDNEMMDLASRTGALYLNRDDRRL